MIAPCAQLRAFLPLDSLSERELARWPEDRRVGLRELRATERRVAERRLVAGSASVRDGLSLTRRMDETVFVCPAQHDLRSANALQQLEQVLPAPVVDLLVPDETLRDHLALVAATGRQPTILDSPWTIPGGWFVLFEPWQKRLRDPPEGDGPSLVYLTRVERALDRIGRAVDVVGDQLAGAEDLLDELADLSGWLEDFDPRGLVELDYGALGDLMGADELRRESSVEDVDGALESLEGGDVLDAAASYAKMLSRWRPLRDTANAS